MDQNETFFSLLGNLAHWEFELFLLVIFDGLIGALLWPRLLKARKHHRSDDQRIEDLEREVAEIKRSLLKPKE